MADKIPLSDLPQGVPGAFDKVAGVDTATGASRLFPLPQAGVPRSYATRASLPAASGFTEGYTVWVNNDPTPANNGTWAVFGGQWVQSADRVSGLEAELAAIESSLTGTRYSSRVIRLPIAPLQGQTVNLLGTGEVRFDGTNWRKVSTDALVAATPRVLDLVPGASLAVGLDNLAAGYGGALADIFSTATGATSQYGENAVLYAEPLSGGGDLLCTQLYDQSGNGRHFVPVGAAVGNTQWLRNRPALVIAGRHTANGLGVPALRFTGNQVLRLVAGLNLFSGLQAATVMMVHDASKIAPDNVNATARRLLHVSTSASTTAERLRISAGVRGQIQVTARAADTDPALSYPMTPSAAAVSTSVFDWNGNQLVLRQSGRRRNGRDTTSRPFHGGGKTTDAAASQAISIGNRADEPAVVAGYDWHLRTLIVWPRRLSPEELLMAEQAIGAGMLQDSAASEVSVPDAVLSWWTEPVAIRQGETVYGTGVRRSGESLSTIMAYQRAGDSRSAYASLSPIQNDDHNNACLVPPMSGGDGTAADPWLAFYCNHNGDSMLRIRRASGPGVTAWGPETTIATGNLTTYAKAYRLPGTPSTVVVFFRHLHTWMRVVSTDNGLTWSSAREVIGGDGTTEGSRNRVYMTMRHDLDGLNATVGAYIHPNDPSDKSIYLFRVNLTTGEWTHAGTGAVVGNHLTASDPMIDYRAGLLAVPPTPDKTIRMLDIAPDGGILYMTWTPGNPTSVPGAFADATYYYARHIGGGTVVRLEVPMAPAGRTAHASYDDESGYFGWGCLLDDGTAIVCREQATQWYMERYHPIANGASFRGEVLERTTYGVKLYRPISVRNDIAVTYCRGGYESSVDYSADVCYMPLLPVN